MKGFLAFFMLLAFLASPGRAQNLPGTWQGMAGQQRVLKIRATAEGLRGEFYNLGEEVAGRPRNGNTVSAIARDGRTVRFSLDNAAGDFEGILARDGQSITGTWEAGGPPQPLVLNRATAKTAWVIDPSPHKSLFVTVQPGLKLEVLDWGGSGPPLIFLAGLGGTGHSFDGFAPRFTSRHHVYAITRRGFGASGAPPVTDENYDADRLGDDVLAVTAALKIDRPVLAGHSIAGQELSSVGTRHPETIAGLVYLDAVFQYAFYNPAQPDLSLDTAIVKRGLGRMFELQQSPAQWRALIAELQAALPNLERSLAETAQQLEVAPDESAQAQKPEDLAGNRIFANTRRYGPVQVPVLAVLAMPRRCAPNCEKPFTQKIMAADAARAELFEKQNPGAKVVRIPQASHFVFRSHADDVEREMNAFTDGLPKP